MPDLVSGQKVPMASSLEVVMCCACGMPFALHDQRIRVLRDTGERFYCPNGHPQSFPSDHAQKIAALTADLERTKRTLSEKEKGASAAVKEKNVFQADLKTLQTVHNKDQAELQALREAKVTLTKANELLVAAVKKLEVDNAWLKAKVKADERGPGTDGQTPEDSNTGESTEDARDRAVAREEVLAYLLANPYKKSNDVAAHFGGGISQQYVAGLMYSIQKTKERNKLVVPPTDGEKA